MYIALFYREIVEKSYEMLAPLSWIIARRIACPGAIRQEGLEFGFSWRARFSEASFATKNATGIAEKCHM